MSTEPLDLYLLTLEIEEKVGGIVHGRSVNIKNQKFTMNHNGHFEEKENLSFGTCFRHMTSDTDNFLALDNMRNPQRSIDEFTNSIKRRQIGGSYDQIFEQQHFPKGILKFGDIDRDSLKNEGENLLNDIRTHLKEYLKDDFKITLSLEIEEEQKTFTSSSGAHIVQKFSRVYLLVHLISIKHWKIDLYRMIGGIHMSSISWEKLLKTVTEISAEANLLSKAKIETRLEGPLLFSNDATWTLFHETIGHAVESENNVSTYLENYLGTKVAPSHVSVIDDKGIDSVGSYGFDDEGFKAAGAMIIEEGILNTMLYGLKDLKRNVMPTGNTRSSTYKTKPQVRQSNLIIEPGDFTTEELLERSNNGYFIGPMFFASADVSTGHFMIYPQYIQKIEDGDLRDIFLCPPFYGNAVDVLRNLGAIGKDIINRPAFCIKNNDRIPVGMISPKVAIENVRLRS